MTPSESAQLTNCIRKLRFEHGEMTQQELADRVGAASRHLSTEALWSPQWPAHYARRRQEVE